MKCIGLVFALAAAGCGSSGPNAANSAGSPDGSKAASMVAFAQCMRTHGVPNFPDLGNQGMRIQATPSSVSVNGIRLSGPAFNSAQQACHSKLPNGGKPPQLNASQRQAALQFSQCMRSHGLPNFPDPNFTGGGVRIQIGPSGGLNPNSPAFKTAQQACQPVLRRALPGQKAGG